MKAAEFISQPHDNVVDLPVDLHAWNGRRVRVILLEEEQESVATPAFSALHLKTRGVRFDREEANAR